MRRRTLTSPRLKRKRRKVFIRRSLLAGALIISIFLGLKVLLNSDIFIIKSIEVIGAQKIPREDITSLISSEIDTSKFGIFNRRNFLFIDTKSISDLVAKSFPDFSKVRTTLAGLGSLVVEVVERSPYAKWCDKSNPEQCFIVDDTGFAFKKDNNQNSTTILSIITQTKPVYASVIFNTDKFSKLKDLIGYFNQAGFKIKSVIENDNDYFFKTSDGLEIRIGSDDNPDSIITKLTSIENDLKKENNTSTIDYIDLRYGNKVYIKRR